MEQLTNADFVDFIESYKHGEYDNHKFYDTITEISRSGTEKADALIENDFKMYDLDWMAKASKNLKHNLPKTTDAIFFNDKTSSLHIIEFKFISSQSHKTKLDNLWMEIVEQNNKAKLKKSDEFYGEKRTKKCFGKTFVDDFDRIRKSYKDTIEFSLQLKPFESIFIVLPELYDEYCDDNKMVKKDIKSYLTNIKKYYWVFLGNKSKSKTNVQAHAKRLEKPYKRLEKGVFEKARIKSNFYFDLILEKEILGNAF